MMSILAAIFIGACATVCIDLWASFSKRVFGVPSLDFCFLGRWLLHARNKTIVHENIAKSAPMRHECKTGWAAHYSIGVAFAIAFVLLAPKGWLDHPTVLPALGFGIVTVIVPFVTIQPAFGLGVAASKTPAPAKARLKSVMTHAVFGLGLYAGASVLGALSQFG